MITFLVEPGIQVTTAMRPSVVTAIPFGIKDSPIWIRVLRTNSPSLVYNPTYKMSGTLVFPACVLVSVPTLRVRIVELDLYIGGVTSPLWFSFCGPELVSIIVIFSAE